MTQPAVTACLVTRGDVDMSPVIATLPPSWSLIVWDNSLGENLGVYGRYAAVEQALTDVVYVQDDDCIVPPESIWALIAAYQPGHVVCNMPEPWRRQRFYQDHALVGFGAVFDRDLPAKAFARYEQRHPHGDHELARRRCDVVFTSLTPRILVDVPFVSLPYATGPDRMYRQPEHALERRKVLKLARQAR